MPSDKSGAFFLVPLNHVEEYFCCMQIETLYNIYRQHSTVQTDTRKLKTGDIFFALKRRKF